MKNQVAPASPPEVKPTSPAGNKARLSTAPRMPPTASEGSRRWAI